MPWHYNYDRHPFVQLSRGYEKSRGGDMGERWARNIASQRVLCDCKTFVLIFIFILHYITLKQEQN